MLPPVPKSVHNCLFCRRLKPLLATVNSEDCLANNSAETPEGESGPHINMRQGRTICLRKNPADGVAYPTLAQLAMFKNIGKRAFQDDRRIIATELGSPLNLTIG
jgi:hypothetical protein